MARIAKEANETKDQPFYGTPVRAPRSGICVVGTTQRSACPQDFKDSVVVTADNFAALSGICIKPVELERDAGRPSLHQALHLRESQWRTASNGSGSRRITIAHAIDLVGLDTAATTAA